MQYTILDIYDDDKRNDALRTILENQESLLLGAVEELKKFRSDFNPLSWYIYILGVSPDDIDELNLIFAHNQSVSDEELFAPVDAWLEKVSYKHPEEFVRGMISARDRENVDKTVRYRDPSETLDQIISGIKPKNK